MSHILLFLIKYHLLDRLQTLSAIMRWVGLLVFLIKVKLKKVFAPLERNAWLRASIQATMSKFLSSLIWAGWRNQPTQADDGPLELE
jgi:hypothetical protein